MEIRPSQSEVQLREVASAYFQDRVEVEPMFEGVGDENGALARIYLVRGNASFGDQNPWDVAYDLWIAGDFERVEPDLQTTLEPETRRAAAACFGNEGVPAPSDPGWALRRMKVDRAWALPPPPGGRRFGEGIRICHPDTGWTQHDDLDAGRIDLEHARNIMDGGADAEDPLDYAGNPGHGTSTGSVIASEGRIAEGTGTTGPGRITGVAPAATLVPLRTVKSVVQAFDSDVAKAVYHSVDAGCDVISMSLGGRAFFGLERAVDYAVDRGLIVVAAAGNCVGFVVAPALYENVIAAAASNAQDEPWIGSSRGRAVTITAPGEDVWSARRTADSPDRSKVEPSNGTSYATAEVAGAAALWLAFNGSAERGAHRQATFREVLESSVTTPTGWDTGRYGPGILDVERLLSVTPRAAAHSRSASRGDIALLARMLDRDEAQVEEAVRRLADGSLAPEADREHFVAELIYVALQDPRRFQTTIDEILEPRTMTSAARSRARNRLAGLVSQRLNSAMSPPVE